MSMLGAIVLGAFMTSKASITLGASTVALVAALRQLQR